MSVRMRAVVVAMSLAVATVASACSASVHIGGSSYSASKIESQLRRSQQGHVGGLKLGAATCPDSEKLDKGVTFICQLRIADTEVPYRITVTSVKSDVAHLDFHATKAILKRSTIEQFVSQNLNDQSQGATVHCGTGTRVIVLADPGDRITCSLSLGEQKGSVKVEVTDLKGSIKVVG